MDVLQTVLGLSILAQLTASWFALRLIFITKKKTTWLLIGIAILLMTLRRIVLLLWKNGDAVNVAGTLYAEGIGLAISVMLAAGLVSAGSFFKSLKRTENDLRESRSELAAVFDNAPVPMLLVNGQRLVRKANRALCSLLKCDPEELTGLCTGEALGCPRAITGKKSACGFDPHCDTCQIRRLLRETIETGRNHHQVETEFMLSLGGEGKKRCLLLSTALIENDGKRLGLLCMEDITDRKDAEKTLKESERRFRSILDTVKLLTVILDDEGRIIFCNDYLLELTDYTRHEVLERKWTDLFIPEDVRPEISTIFDKTIKGKEFPAYYENEILTRDGRRLFIAWNNTVIRDADGNIVGATSLGVNLTAQRQLEAQLRQSQKLEAIGTLAAGVAHDFNNTLSLIIGYTEMAGEALSLSNVQQARADLGEVLTASGRAKELVKQILTFAGHREEKHPVPTDLAGAVKEVTRFMRSALPTTTTLNIHMGVTEAIILGDPTQIYQVVLNLCKNAADSLDTAMGKVDISIDAEEISTEHAMILQLPPGRYFKISVSDNGKGMDAETRKRIFDPYFTTKAPNKGTGLGLAVVLGIVQRYGGAVHVESEPEKGSLFRVYFPPAHKKSPESAGDVDAPLPGNGQTVLWVDDEDRLVALGERMLTKLGYRVVGKTNGTEAWESFAANPQGFDLVFTDQTMPGMTGLALAEKILSIRPDIPVILCTGYSETVDESLAKQRGILEMVMKPLTAQEVSGAIDRALGKKDCSEPISDDKTPFDK